METQLIKNGKHSVAAFRRSKNAEHVPSAGKKREERAITKEEAKTLLATVGPEQRGIDQGRVEGFARTMDLDLWDEGVGRDVIAIHQDGRLINGQNRLAALVISRLAEIRFMVVTGCDDEDIKTFDCDTKNRTSKLCHPELAFPARTLARITSLDRLVSGNVRMKHTHAILDQLSKKWRKTCAWANEVMPSPGAQGRASYVAAFMYVYMADAEFADKHAKAWGGVGSGLPPTLSKVRDAAMKSRGPVGKKSLSVNVRASLKTLNALASVHQKKERTVINDSLSGLKYWSGILRDGAAKRWDDQFSHVTSEE